MAFSFEYPNPVYDPNDTIPPAVRHGLMTQTQHNKIQHYLANDPQRFVKYALKLCYNNYALWTHLFLGYDVVPHSVEVWNIVENYRNNVVLLPRSHSKTYMFTVGLLTHNVCYSTIPGSKYEDPRILLIRESADAASKDIGMIQSIIEQGGHNGLIHAAFGNIKEKARKWNDNAILVGKTTSRDFTLAGTGANGNITGTHPRLILIDDPVTKKNANTDHLRNEMWSWWTKTLVGTMDPRTRVFLLGTPHYANDLYHRLMETGKYNVVKIPALSRFPEKEDWTPVYDQNGIRIGVELTEAGSDIKALWPCPLGNGNCRFWEDPEHFEKFGEHRSVEWLIHEKYLEDPVDFSGQFMLEIVGAGKAIIKKDMLRFFSDNPHEVGDGHDYNDTSIVPFPSKDEIVSIVHAWDHAIGKKRSHDNTAFARLFRTRDNRVFVKVQAGKWDFATAVDKMESYYETEPYGDPVKIVTEAIGFQEAFNQQLMRQSKRILSDKVEPIRKSVDKGEYLNKSGLPVAMMNGQVYFDINDKETIMELLNFTADDSSGFHDDRVDAIAMGFDVIKEMIKRPVRLYKIDTQKKGFNRFSGGRRVF